MWTSSPLTSDELVYVTLALMRLWLLPLLWIHCCVCKSSFGHAGIQILSKVGSLLVQESVTFGPLKLCCLLNMWLLPRVLLPPSADCTAPASGLTQDDLSDIFLEKNVWRRATEGSTHIYRFEFKLKQICWISIKNEWAVPQCNVCLHLFLPSGVN